MVFPPALLSAAVPEALTNSETLSWVILWIENCDLEAILIDHFLCALIPWLRWIPEKSIFPLLWEKSFVSRVCVSLPSWETFHVCAHSGRWMQVETDGRWYTYDVFTQEKEWERSGRTYKSSRNPRQIISWHSPYESESIFLNESHVLEIITKKIICLRIGLILDD